MLVLGRRPGQRIIIDAGGERIVITLVDSAKWWAKIGIQAGPAVQVRREELTQEKDHARATD